MARAVVEAKVLDEEEVRDQLSAAEELLHVGHEYPAAVAAGAAIEGMLRLRGAPMVGPTASAHDLLELLWEDGEVAEIEHERLRRALSVRDHLSRGFAPPDPACATGERTQSALNIAVRLMEDLPEAASRASDQTGDEPQS